jgi:hypothetical protein
MLVTCPKCKLNITIPDGSRVPPWCNHCGAGLKAVANPAVPPPPPPPGSATTPCPKCAFNITQLAGDRPPPWCPKCGADIKSSSPAPTPAPAPDAAAVPEPATAPAIRVTIRNAGTAAPAASSPVTGSPVAAAAVKMVCGRCGADMAESGPWCRKCGADAKDAVATLAGSQAEADAKADKEWDDRFGGHNLLVGLLLAVWGAMQQLRPAAKGGPLEYLESLTTLNNATEIAEIATALGGAALAASGAAIKAGKPWGYKLAVACAVVNLLAGLVFFSGYASLLNAKNLVQSVAIMAFVQQHFEMLLGTIDGAGLLYFLNKYRGETARRAWRTGR